MGVGVGESGCVYFILEVGEMLVWGERGCV